MSYANPKTRDRRVGVDIKLEWIKINRDIDEITPMDLGYKTFLLINENGYIWRGFNAFDYYDEAKYWFPEPEMPKED